VIPRSSEKSTWKNEEKKKISQAMSYSGPVFLRGFAKGDTKSQSGLVSSCCIMLEK